MRYCEKCGAAFRFARTCPRDDVPTTAGSFDPLIGRVLGDRYRILDRIGAGGMGQVYRAAHTRIACVFAVKVVWGDFAYDTSMQTRFTREAEVASCLQSRHIVRVVDFAEDAGTLPYLVMEYLDGPTLYDVIAREGRLTPARAASITIGILRGLSHAHQRGVVHRDLKPENVVLVTEEDERDVVKVLDFGVARLRDDDRLTGFGVSVGTPLYMAPEQLAAGDVDGRADLYSLGIVLFEMLTGKTPFQGSNLQELTRQHFQDAPPSLRSGPTTSPADPGILDDVVRKLLAKSAADRFASAKEVVAAIQRALAPGSSPSIVPSRRAAIDGAVQAQLERVILQGAPRYNAGDHAGCYGLYRGVAEQILRGGQATLAAVGARLTAGLARAATRTNPTDAAWDMRYAFDDLLTARSATLPDDALGSELSMYAAIAQGRESEGKFDLLGDYQIAFANALAGSLRTDARYTSSADVLEAAARRAQEAGGGRAAVPLLGPLLARLRGGAPVDQVNAPPTVVSMPPMSTSFVTDEVRELLSRAIRAGAPVYDQGQPDVCERIYRQTAIQIVARAGSTGRDPVTNVLQRALQDATGKPPDEGAWVFRRAFDTILAAR
ncbi:MAG: serine/threonine protein kinase [Polyangiaceae bacterium]|nr:serine/threonine protein kinase [Polyangiaceae bacterium]